MHKETTQQVILFIITSIIIFQTGKRVIALKDIVWWPIPHTDTPHTKNTYDARYARILKSHANANSW